MIKPDSSIKLGIESLEEDIEALELPDTLNALTVGRRCARLGYEFHWRPFAEAPDVRRPDGTDLDVFVEDFVPHIMSQSAMPGKSHYTIPSMPAAVVEDWYEMAARTYKRWVTFQWSSRSQTMREHL